MYRLPSNRNSAAKSLLLVSLCLIGAKGASQDKPDWQKHIDWASGDTGAPDCPGLYETSDLKACLALGVATGNHDGNRKCVISLARVAAKSGDPRLAAVAYSYVLLTQCHNGKARQQLMDAGLDNVVGYLR